MGISRRRAIVFRFHLAPAIALASVRRRPTVEAKAVIVCGVAWLIGSCALAVSDVMRPELSRGRGGLELMSRAGSSAHCGVALMVAWSWTGGYSSLHQKLPIHLLSPYDPGDWDTRTFDAWIGPQEMRGPEEAGFRLVQCSVQNAGSVAGRSVRIRARSPACEVIDPDAHSAVT
jgi:hypothetical protein